MKKTIRLFLFFFVLAGIIVSYFVYRSITQSRNSGRESKVLQWIRNPEAHTEWAIQAGAQCQDAPFILPTDGFIGYLWGDSFRPGHHHQGIDIFGGTSAGVVPIIAAYDGYLTRLPDWKSTVIIRVPNDPLQPGRQIWTYYTHLADEDGISFISEDFPPGTYEEFVPAGTFLGYQGDYSGTPGNPTGVHLHFSIVKDDGEGGFLNELDINNTLDSSPYFGMNLNAHENQGEIPACLQE